MPYEVTPLAAGDFDDLMKQLFLAFRERVPFAELLPSVYQPDDEHMRHIYAVRHHGDLVASIGCFPIELMIGDTLLKVAGIGGVATTHTFRGRGLMKAIMDRVLEVIQAEGYDATYLGGQRQRYGYWGYERCGNQICFDISQQCLKHSFRDLPSLTLHEWDRHPDLAARALELHDRQPIHGHRGPERFVRLLKSWQMKPWVALDATGDLAGYLTVNPETNYIAELVGRDHHDCIDMLRAWSLSSDKPINLVQPPLACPLNHALAGFAEAFKVDHNGNWLVLNWPKILEALLRLKHQTQTLMDGEVHLEIEGQGTFALKVASQTVTCEPSQAEPDLSGDVPSMHRLLFGPLPPALSPPFVPGKAEVLNAWLPLPLYIPRQDKV